MVSAALSDALWAFRRRLPSQARIYVAGCSGEPLILADFLSKHPEWAAGVTFCGIWIPGVNRTDWTRFHPSSRAEGIFLSHDLEEAFAARRFNFYPLSYTQSCTWLATGAVDGVIVVTSPAEDNFLSLGVSSDFSSILLDRPDLPALALCNEHMRSVEDAPRYPVDRFVATVSASHPLPNVPVKSLPSAFEAIGRNIAGLVENGDTLQFGLGNVQQAVLQSLTSHEDLRIHSGMVSDPVLELLDNGAIADRAQAITTGVAIGTEQLYQRLAGEKRATFRPVTYTHALKTLAAIKRFKAINSCISIDLFGQANGEFMGTRQISGAGGLVDFLRGSAASTGGMGIIALTSTARGGTISRIVPRLPPNAISIARADMDKVVTEHGVADLRGRSVEQRAEALIAVAAPEFRSELTAEWEAMRKEMS